MQKIACERMTFLSWNKVELLQAAGVRVELEVICMQSVTIHKLEARTIVAADPCCVGVGVQCMKRSTFLFLLQILVSHGDGQPPKPAIKAVPPPQPPAEREDFQ